MTEDKVTLFKLDLRTLPLLKKKREGLALQLEEVVYNLQNVRGIDTAKEPLHIAKDIRLQLIERKDDLQAQIDKVNDRIDDIYKKLGYFSKPMQRALVAIYCDRIPVVKVAEKYGYSESTFRRIINRQISKYIDSHDA